MTGTISIVYKRHSWLQFFTPSLFHMYSQMKKMNFFIQLRGGALQLLDYLIQIPKISMNWY